MSEAFVSVFQNCKSVRARITEDKTQLSAPCHRPIIEPLSPPIIHSYPHQQLCWRVREREREREREEETQKHTKMWEELPLDILSRIFSFLPPNSLAYALCACKHWYFCGRFPALPSRYRPWFIAMPSSRSHMHTSSSHHSTCCYAHDPDLRRWYSLPMDFTPEPIRLVSYLSGGILLCRFTSSASSRLVICNPFTRQICPLPDLLTSRSNPAIGVVTGNANTSLFYYIVVVAGGASGISYESTLEVYDSRRGGDGWRLVGPMPTEFAVRLTVWTPNESVHTGNGFLYWMTSARAYSVVRLDLACWGWSEVKLPMADRLDWAAIFKRRNGRLGLVGGSAELIGQAWELHTETCDEWGIVGSVPTDLETGFGRGGIRCAGAGDAVYLYRDLGSDMLVWSEIEGEEGWNWVEGRCNLGINSSLFKAVLIHPSLSRSLF